MMTKKMRLAYMVATPDVLSKDALGYAGDPDHCASLLRDLGYDGIELTTADPAKLDWDELAGAIGRAGLEVPLVCTGEVFGQSHLGLASPDQEVRAAALDRIKSMIRFAAVFGANVNIGRSRGHYCQGVERKLTEKWAHDAFCELADYAAPYSVTIALEPIAAHVCNFINSTQDGLEWMRRVNRPNFKLMLDVYHMNIEDTFPMEESIAQAVAADAVVHVHLCDTNRRPPGWGHMDFAGVIDALSQAGYKEYVSAEVFNFPDQESAIRRSAEVLRPLVP